MPTMTHLLKRYCKKSSHAWRALALVAGWCACADVGLAQNLNYGFVPTIGTSKKEFSFAIWGDPQVAYYEPGTKFDNPENKKNFETVVPRLHQAVRMTNRLSPEFVVTLGDNIHNTGEWENFKLFVDAVKPLQMPLYLLMGNHDHVPAADSFATNPLKDREFANFVWAQKQINGLEHVVYSFDAGDWHLVLFSQPGGVGYGVDEYMDTHPELVTWLDADLRANQNRPTMFFTHHPILPVGRFRFDVYGPGAANRGKLADLLTRYGNVKYAFFGHVHNTVASISLLSWRYKGVAFILLPNASNTARLDDYLENARSPYGVGMVKLNQQTCESITFHTLAGETFVIDPATFGEYDDSFYGYLKPESELPAAPFVRNGNFEENLAPAWLGEHLLAYAQPPQQKREVRWGDGAAGQYLYLAAAGQPLTEDSRSYITSSVRQVLTVPPLDKWPVLRLRYKISSQELRHPEVCNAFIEISAYKAGERARRFGLGYGLGRTYSFFGLRGSFASLELKPVFDQWQELVIYPRSDLEKYFLDKDWQYVPMDCLVLTLGVLNENYSPDSTAAHVGVSFDAVEWFTVDRPTPPTVGVMDVQQPLPRKFVLFQNYPNPFNPNTTFSFFAPRDAEVSLKIFDLSGRSVATVFEGAVPAGSREVTWRADGAVASGIYWAVFQEKGSPRRSRTKVLLLR